MSVVVNGTSIQAQGQVDEGGQWVGFESPVRFTSKAPLTTSDACTKLEGVYQKFQACGNYGIAQSPASLHKVFGHFQACGGYGPAP